jgi:hypothetical protein
VLSHTSLGDYYQIIFAMAQHHNWSLNEIENMLPYERELYFGMIVDFIAKQNENN